MLDAATRVLGQRPEAPVDEIAALAGVSRQTVYAHFPSRQALLTAVVEQITATVVATIEAAGLERGSAMGALRRWLDTAWDLIDRYPLLLHPSLATADPRPSQEQHAPILDQLARLVRRGQAGGEFDPRLSTGWLLAATVALGHAAGNEVAAGRMTSPAARAAFRDGIIRLYRAEPVVTE